MNRLGVRRLLKFLHELSTVGIMGAAATQLILSHLAVGRPASEFYVLRLAILRVSELVLLPSMLVVLASGLLAMIAHPPFTKRLWALAKLFMTLLVLETTLVAVQGPAQTAHAIAREWAAGDASRLHLLGYVQGHERGGCKVLLFLSAVNIALAIWRPTMKKSKSTRKAAPPSPDEPAQLELDWSREVGIDRASSPPQAELSPRSNATGPEKSALVG
ncbi:MAG: hypothetical protein AAGA56_18990 [Myxococcota bacterium]